MDNVAEASTKLFVDKKQRNLLLESEVTKEFPFLISLLQKYEKLSHGMVSTLPREQQNFFENSFPQVLKQAQAEWIAEGGCHDLGEVSTQCSICNTPNRYLYYIINQGSGKTINVGSECIKKFFDDITEKIGHSKFDSFHRQNIEQARKIRRLHEFNQVYPGAEKMLTSWIDDFNSLPYMVLVNLEKEYKENYYRGRELIKEFQDRKTKDDLVFEQFKMVIDKRQKIWARIEDHFSKIKGDKFAVTRDISNWLTNNRKKGLIEFLKSSCLINHTAFSEVWEPKFLSGMIPSFNDHLSKVNFVIAKADHSRAIFNLNYTGKLKLTFEISFRNLMIILAPKIFGIKDTLSHDRILDDCAISGDHSTRVFMGELDEYYKNNNIIIHSYYTNFNEVVIVNQSKRMYKVANLSIFIKDHMVIFYKTKKQI